MKTPLNIIFMGTPDFAVTALDAIAQSGHKVVCVYCQPPRPAGRGHKLQPTPVHRRAEELGLPVRHPLSFKKDAEACAEFASLNADIAVVAAYGLILPLDVLNAPKHGCLNIHASLLPRWRGAAPIQRAILAGDEKTGICIMQMEEGLDTGPVLLRDETPIISTTTASTLHDTLAAQGGKLIVDALNLIAAGTPPSPQKQDAAQSTYAKMLSKEDGRIDWAKPAQNIERQLRALTPWPGVWCIAGDERLKVLAADIVNRNGKPGEVLSRDLTIACGTGALILKTVQPQDRKAMDGASFMNGGGINVGDILA